MLPCALGSFSREKRGKWFPGDPSLRGRGAVEAEPREAAGLSGDLRQGP